MHWTIALIDHESAGTWDENTVGDSGCSVGLAQWNHCVGNYGPEDFDGQVTQIGQEMLTRFQEFSIEIAIGKHNAPALDTISGYTESVKASKNILS